MVDDIRRASPDQVDGREAIAEVSIFFRNQFTLLIPFLKIVQAKYTMGPEIQQNAYHVATVRSPLTKNLAVRFAEVQDEIACAFDDFIPRTEG